MAPRVVDKDKKRTQIQRAALKVIAKQGPSDLKMADVAAAAGVGKGTLYEYFPSKTALVAGAFNEFFEEFREHVAATVEQVDSPKEKLSQFVTGSFQFFRRHKDYVDALFDFYAAGIPRKESRTIMLDMSESYRASIRWLTGIISDGITAGEFRNVDADFAASMTLAALDGFLYQAAVGVISIHDDRLLKQFEDIVLNGIGRE